MDCAPRKFVFQCQRANFPQLFLLSKNQQCLWTTDNILNGTSGEEKKKHNKTTNQKTSVFVVEQNQTVQSWKLSREKLFGYSECFVCCTTWFARPDLVLVGGPGHCCDVLHIHGRCWGGSASSHVQIHEELGRVLWRHSHSEHFTRVCRLCAIPCTRQRQIWTHPCGKWEPSEMLSRVSRGSTLAGDLLSWLSDGERRRPEWLQHLGVRVFWTSEEFFHLLSPPSHLDFHGVLSSSPLKLLKESWKETLSCPSWYLGQDKVRFLERPELNSYLSQKCDLQVLMLNLPLILTPTKEDLLTSEVLL